jgi:hypothetical protein
MYDLFMGYVSVGLVWMLIALAWGDKKTWDWLHETKREMGAAFTYIIVGLASIVWCLTWPFWVVNAVVKAKIK